MNSSTTTKSTSSTDPIDLNADPIIATHRPENPIHIGKNTVLVLHTVY